MIDEPHDHGTWHHKPTLDVSASVRFLVNLSRLVRGRVPRIIALLEKLYPEGSVPDWIEMKELKAQLAAADPYFAKHIPDDKTVRDAKKRFNLLRRA
jgi:hypothetical protein